MREQLGNHIFLSSGLLRTFDQLEVDDVGVPASSWIEDYFFDTHGVTPAQQIADRALELTERADRGRPRAWQTALFASQHELITYRKQTREHGTPAIGDRAARVRTIARWVLPYGIQLQLRQARARRKALRRPAAEEAQMAGVAPPHNDAEMAAEEASPSAGQCQGAAARP